MNETSFELIFDRFLRKVTDYELADLLEEEIENDLIGFLRGAVTDFKYCKSNLKDRNDNDKKFKIELEEDEQEILAKFMLVHWITPNVLRLENIRQNVSNKDFQISSGANFIDKLTTLKRSLIAEAQQDMIFYYYST